MTDLSAQWTRLEHLHSSLSQQSLADLFASDTQRFDKLSTRFEDILVDYSKERINEEILESLFELARCSKLDSSIQRLFNGDKVNFTEQRSVLHMALRHGVDPELQTDNKNIAAEVSQVLDQFLSFADEVRSGRYHSVDGTPFTDIINIGIGGSDLGPQMATMALQH